MFQSAVRPVESDFLWLVHDGDAIEGWGSFWRQFDTKVARGARPCNLVKLAEVLTCPSLYIHVRTSRTPENPDRPINLLEQGRWSVCFIHTWYDVRDTQHNFLSLLLSDSGCFIGVLCYRVGLGSGRLEVRQYLVSQGSRLVIWSITGWAVMFPCGVGCLIACRKYSKLIELVYFSLAWLANEWRIRSIQRSKLGVMSVGSLQL